MKSVFSALAALFVLALAGAAEAQVATTFLPPPAPVLAAAPPVIVSPPAPVVTYYSAPVVTYYSAPAFGPVFYPRRYVVPAPIVVRPRTYVLRPKVFVRGQPVRNYIRAVTP